MLKTLGQTYFSLPTCFRASSVNVSTPGCSPTSVLTGLRWRWLIKKRRHSENVFTITSHSDEELRARSEWRLHGTVTQETRERDRESEWVNVGEGERKRKEKEREREREREFLSVTCTLKGYPCTMYMYQVIFQDTKKIMSYGNFYANKFH